MWVCEKFLIYTFKYSTNKQQDLLYFILVVHADEDFILSHLQPKKPLRAGTRKQCISFSARWAKPELEEEDNFLWVFAIFNEAIEMLKNKEK